MHGLNKGGENLKYYNGDNVSFGNVIIETLHLSLNDTVLEILLCGKKIIITEYGAESKREINAVHLTKGEVRILISALAHAL